MTATLRRMPPNPDGRPTTMPKEWATLADAAGGVAELAEALGVTKVTLWRWSKGAPLTRQGQMVLATWCAMHGVKAPKVELVEKRRP